MTIFLTILHVIVAIALIGFVLVQEGNDGGISGAIGGGMTQSVVHKKIGMEEKIVRATAVVAGLFFLTAIIVLLV